VLRATGLKSETNAELAWPLGLVSPGEHWRLYRGVAPDALTQLVTPDGYLGTSFDDQAAPDALYFYTLVRADCAGVEGP
jgi:hypothetical protein